MKTLFLISVLLVSDSVAGYRPSKPTPRPMPAIPRRVELVIATNPTTMEGKLIKQHLTRDWIKFIYPKLKNQSLHSKAGLLAQIVPAEYKRRRLYKHFSEIRFVETSGQTWFRVGRSDRIYMPDEYDIHPMEFPGYITFFDWVARRHFHGYYLDRWRVMTANMRSYRTYAVSCHRYEFIDKMRTKGYNYEYVLMYVDDRDIRKTNGKTLVTQEAKDKHKRIKAKLGYSPGQHSGTPGFLKRHETKDHLVLYTFSELGYDSDEVPRMKVAGQPAPDPPKCPLKKDWDLP